MSHGTGLGLDRHQERDFILSTTEEFVKRFGGTRVINKVSLLSLPPTLLKFLKKFSVHSGADRQQWHCRRQVYAFHPSMVVRDVQE